MHELANRLRKATDAQAIASARAQLLTGGWLLEILHDDPERYFTASATKSSISNDEIDAKIEARKTARKDGDYQLADDIRDELAAAGIELEDSREGTLAPFVMYPIAIVGSNSAAIWRPGLLRGWFFRDKTR